MAKQPVKALEHEIEQLQRANELLRIEKDAAVEKANNMQIALGRERLMWKVSLRQAGRRRRRPPPLARLILTIQTTFMLVLPIYW